MKHSQNWIQTCIDFTEQIINTVKNILIDIKIATLTKLADLTILLHGQDKISSERFLKIITYVNNKILSLYLNRNENIEDYDLKHYGLAKNELIKRGYIEGDIISLNDYTNDFEFSF